MQGFWDWFHAYIDRWHDAWEVVGAAATLAAVVISLFTAALARRGRQKAEDERDAARAAQRAAENAAAIERREQQARAVAVWVTQKIAYDGPDGTPLPIDDWTGQTGVFTRVLHVSNHSAMPIFDVQVSLVDAQSNEVWDSATRAIVLPGDEAVIDGPQFSPSVGDGERGPGMAFAMFRDTAGVDWRRTDDGALMEMH